MTRLFFFTLFLSLSAVVLAQEEPFSRTFESTYFTIRYQSGVSSLEVAKKLDFSTSPRLVLENQSNEVTENPEAVLAKQIDALFLEVSDILDMRLARFKGEIKICRELQSLKGVYYHRYNKDLGTVSFYLYDTNTIYIAASDVKAGVLGHEMAHAIISQFFVVLPPHKVQEILAGYVEYQLKKR